MGSPPLIFLGIANRISPQGLVAPTTLQNIKGLRQALVSSIYPLDLSNHVLVIGCRTESPPPKIRFSVHAEKDERLLMTAGFELERGGSGQDVFGTWTIFGLSLRDTDRKALVLEPGAYVVRFEDDSGSVDIGKLHFIYARAPELTASRIAAIRSSPSATKAVRFVLACDRCKAILSPYAGLDQPTTPDPKLNIVWYRDLPDRFTCDCGLLDIDLRYVRQNLHCLLGRERPFLADGTLASTSETTRADIQSCVDEFHALLKLNPVEAEVQSFIEQHPLLLSPFGAERLFMKPPILNQHFADFGLTTSRNELHLIEIERPGLRLFNKDGSPSAPLTHAITQTRDWKAEIAENRSAVLRCIPECPAEIARFKYTIIAGRTTDDNRERLHRFAATHEGSDFMTYDQLIETVLHTTAQVFGP